MKDMTISIRIDPITEEQLKDLRKWIYEEFMFEQTTSDIIRTAISQMHKKYYVQKNN